MGAMFKWARMLRVRRHSLVVTYRRRAVL